MSYYYQQQTGRFLNEEEQKRHHMDYPAQPTKKQAVQAAIKWLEEQMVYYHSIADSLGRRLEAAQNFNQTLE